MTIELSERELGLVLCALRCYQDLFTENFPHFDPGLETEDCRFHGTGELWKEDELGALCERLNEEAGNTC